MNQKIVFISQITNLSTAPSYYNNIIGFYAQTIDILLSSFDYSVVFISEDDIVKNDLSRIFNNRKLIIKGRLGIKEIKDNDILITDNINIQFNDIIYYLPSIQPLALENLLNNINEKIKV